MVETWFLAPELDPPWGWADAQGNFHVERDPLPNPDNFEYDVDGNVVHKFPLPEHSSHFEYKTDGSVGLKVPRQTLPKDWTTDDRGYFFDVRGIRFDPYTSPGHPDFFVDMATDLQRDNPLPSDSWRWNKETHEQERTDRLTSDF